MDAIIAAPHLADQTVLDHVKVDVKLPVLVDAIKLVETVVTKLVTKDAVEDAKAIARLLVPEVVLKDVVVGVRIHVLLDALIVVEEPVKQLAFQFVLIIVMMDVLEIAITHAVRGVS